MTPQDPAFLERLKGIVGPAHVLTEPADLAPFLAEERGRYQGAATVAVRPGSTEEVAAVVAACAEAQVPVVPQGGNTGLVGGAVSEAGEVVLALGRLNRIRALDPAAHTLTAEAGCILADLQGAAEDAGLLFPLSLGAEGSCQIGGNLASNAGGLNVLRYGTARDLCLGLEVVLADGRIWHGLSGLTKDNTGYALKHLFIGAEGTLGIITAAVLKLFPRPTESATALLAVPDLTAALDLLGRARARSGDSVSAFEVMNGFSLEVAVRHLPGARAPLEEPTPWAVLVELATSRPDAPLRPVLETLLEEAFEAGLVSDGVIAESLDQRAALWNLREGIPEAQKPEGGSIKHDVSLPLAAIPEFVAAADAAVDALVPGIRPCTFGHLGDGNLHYNLSQPAGADKDAFLARWEEISARVHDLVVERGGSISAEHGIGQLKVAELERLKPALDMDLMHRLKKALDPDRVLNPGKVVR
ncbi:FAD-binding oxidoreductase [Roseospirillum parvum]|uniref:D-lactate dehydrogenase (Cytochrome) n=1 Tax=Roseospirillum parvum TaxID=83401 RepID=A0A1G8FP38_9PROT|nr:FAD-binding oxidoreductase [Roseospirillum parvum]SDH83932.1 D-lactate dehydrogenase (cytochrome) [Roseospirillum parvum]